MKKALLISCFDWYISRLKPIRDLLIEKGFEVTVLEADYDHIKKTSLKKRYPECTYIHVPEYKKNISIQRIKSHLVFGKNVGEVLRQLSPDFVFCQIPPNNVAQFCVDYKQQNPNATFVIDIIDLWPESMPIGVLKNLIPFWKKWRTNAIRVADYVFTECDLYQEKLKGIINPKKTSTLYLYKNQTEEEKNLVLDIISQKKTDDILRFAYLGSMNSIIDIDGICSVIKFFILSGKVCELHAIGDGESRKQFEESVKRTGCRVFFYGRIFNELEKIEILTKCDYALNIMKDQISVGLTIKSIDYLSYGLPLINTIKGDTWSLVENYNIGINYVSSLELIDFNNNHNDVVAVFKSLFSLENYTNTIRQVLLK